MTLGWAVARVLGIERGFPAVQLMAYTPYVAAASVLPLAVALSTRRWLAGGLALVATITLAVCVLPRGYADRSAGPARPGGPTIRVMSANLQFGAVDPERLRRVVEERRVDLLALQEYTPEAERSVGAALVNALPYRVSYPEDGAGGSALYSRFPLRNAGVRQFDWGFTQARGRLEVPGAAPVEVESTHPRAPWNAEATDAWASDLDDLPRAVRDGPVQLLIGDFNATLDHKRLRALLDSGYRDAADVAGQGLTPSWPYDEKWWLPGVTIDHILVDRRVGVGRFAVLDLPGSDHRGLVADLTLPPP